MTEQEKLYETLGELLYVVAMADGLIQKEEVDALKDIFKDHPWGKEVDWSFNYETSKHSNVEDVYKKAIGFCQDHGPSEYYREFIGAMNILAASTNGIDQNEEKVISSFSTDLIAKFQKDLDL